MEDTYIKIHGWLATHDGQTVLSQTNGTAADIYAKLREIGWNVSAESFTVKVWSANDYLNHRDMQTTSPDVIEGVWQKSGAVWSVNSKAFDGYIGKYVLIKIKATHP